MISSGFYIHLEITFDTNDPGGYGISASTNLGDQEVFNKVIADMYHGLDRVELLDGEE